MKEKPLFSEPCNHCGLCCQSELCEVGSIAFPNAKAPCPGLIPAGDAFVCSLIDAEIKNNMGNKLQKSLGVGCGCSMPDDDTSDEAINVFDELSKVYVYSSRYKQGKSIIPIKIQN